MAPDSQAEFVGIVVAAGRGRRFGGPIPKQFELLGGKPVLQLAVEALVGQPPVRGTVVVTAPEHVAGDWGRRIRSWPGVLEVITGGETRAESVARGLAAVPPSATYVLVHDAARPLAPVALIEAVMNATREVGAAVPALPVPDTVKQVDDSLRVVRTLDRSRLRLVQTPQGSRCDWLREALDLAERNGSTVTDEASALELAGHPVRVVPGDRSNEKITTPADLERARRVLDGQEAHVRVGTGFDIHRFGADRPLVLGGVTFDDEPGLIGHSDADVVIHAAMDAVLGAAGLPDIGHHFPPDDPQYAGASSVRLAERVTAMLHAAGYEVVNLDLMLLAERPKIGARREEMVGVLAGCFGIAPDCVGLKATTLERLGALGRTEGLACQAVAMIRRRAGMR